MLLTDENPTLRANDSCKIEEEVKPQRVKEKESDFGWGPWTVQDVLIPPHVGRGHIKTYYQRRTLSQYFSISAGGLWVFFNLNNTAYRAAALGLLFPGAGYAAVATIPSIVAAAFTIVLLGLALASYFAMGAISIPLAVWLGSSVTAGFLARESLYEPSGWICAIFSYGGIAYLIIKNHLSHSAKSRKAEERNKWLVEAVQEHLANATPAPPPGSRELSLETLRHIQFILERGLSGPDDFSCHDVIEQFQGSSLRYQLYSLVDALSLYQCHYVPNFHGYVSLASRNAIEKSLRKEVVSFWKWEAMFGLLKFRDWNPFKNDNIMVTGYLAASMGLYGQATGDKRYQKKDCMEFVVTERKRYKTDYGGLIDALSDNMTKNPFTLYPCEPSWTFPVCNLVGYSGLTISDNLLGRNDASRLRSRFERSLEEEFTDRDGLILALRSELTGFPMRIADSTLFDCMATMILPAFWPHIGHRSWAITRKEVITRDEKGQLQVRAVGGPDKSDPGNYQKGQGALFAFVAVTAGEYGDERIRREALDQLDVCSPVEATNTGSLRNKGLSVLSQSIALMARLVRKEDLAHAARQGPPKMTMGGPLLAQAPFPDVLVAKAFSEDGQKLELVLYNGKEAGAFKVGFERLVPSQKYALSSGGFVTADSAGTASIEINISGRTQVILVPTAQ